jgi:hypothetical protein
MKKPKKTDAEMFAEMEKRCAEIVASIDPKILARIQPFVDESPMSYKEQIKKGLINPDAVLGSYEDGDGNIMEN